MKTLLVTLFVFVLAAPNPLRAASPSAKTPPAGIPADAKLFNGNWYRVYLEAIPWKSAKAKCEQLGGHLAVIPDAPTQAFINELSKGLVLWLGASEKVEGLWVWVDGSPMEYKAWARGEPNNDGRTLNVLVTWHGGWGDYLEKGLAVGYIAEWKAK